MHVYLVTRIKKEPKDSKREIVTVHVTEKKMDVLLDKELTKKTQKYYYEVLYSEVK